MNTFLSLLMSSFYFFNPSIHQYLCIGNDGAYLSSTPQAIELTETNDNTGRYDDNNTATWVLKPLDASQDTYIIGYRVADANATFFLYTDQSTKTLNTTYAEPGIELKEGHWLIADHDFENQQIALDENQNFIYPSLNRPYTDVSLTRTLYANEWNSFCVPFSISEEKIKEVWGEGTKVAKFSNFDGTKLNFSYARSIKANEPCILYPATVHTDDNIYIFNNVEKESWENATPTIQIGDMQFIASYQPTTAPSRSYVLTGNNKMIHLSRNTSMKGYRAYFVCNGASASKQLIWGLDNTPTDIEMLPSNNRKPSASANIYHIDGRLALQKATSTKGLAPGIYILKGKKVKR